MKRIVVIMAFVALMAAPVRGELITFDFDAGTPALNPGQPTPFDHTEGGVTAHFSSPSDSPNAPSFSVQSQNTTFYTLSQFQGRYLCDARPDRDILQIRFNAWLDSVTLVFATTDLPDNTEVPSNLQLTTYRDSTNNVVGSASAHGTFTLEDTFPQGTLSFDSGGVPFNLIELVVPFQGTGTCDFLVDNLTVNQVPEPTGFLLLGMGLLSMIPCAYRRRHRS